MPDTPPDPAPRQQTVFLVEAHVADPERSRRGQQQHLETAGDEAVDFEITSTRTDIRSMIDQAVDVLRQKGLRSVAVEYIGHSAIVHLQHSTYYHVVLAIHELAKAGTVTIRFPETDQPS